jgi:uncharacterized MAPEG superfamily protein
MRPEYQSLAILTLLFLFAWFPSSCGKMRVFGVRWLFSNRRPVEGKALDGWAARCERAHNNLKDNLPGFIVAVLLLGLTNKFDHSTTIASVGYVACRIGHYVSYAIGNVMARAVFFTVGLAANAYLLIKVLI